MSTSASQSKAGLFKWALRLFGSAVFLAGVFYFLPLGDVVAAAKKLKPTVWLGALAIFLTGHVMASLKWRLLISRGGDIPVYTTIRAHFAGLAANLCLPGVAGGDVVRAGIVMRRANDPARIAGGSLLDRLLDTLGLLLLALLGGVWAIGFKVFDMRLAVIVALVAAIGVAAIGGYWLLRKADIKPLRKITEKIDVLIVDFAQRPLQLTACLLLSMTIQSAFILTTILLAKATIADASAAQWFFAWPLAKLVAILPFSLAGLGVREASLAAILGGLGANPAGIVAASLLWQSILFAGGMIGGLILLLTSQKTAPPDGSRTTGLD